MYQEYKPYVYDLQSRFGSRLKKYCRENKLTQEQFAEILDVDPRHLSRWMNGVSLPNITSLLRICRCTGLSADYLIGRGEDYGEDSGD